LNDAEAVGHSAITISTAGGGGSVIAASTGGGGGGGDGGSGELKQDSEIIPLEHLN